MQSLQKKETQVWFAKRELTVRVLKQLEDVFICSFLDQDDASPKQ